mgnify:CR=1 FL=1
MSLLDKKSLYDKQSRGTLGDPIGTPALPGTNPSDGIYYAEDGLNTVSPFTTKGGPPEDHMKARLTQALASGNSPGVNYLAGQLDLNTSDAIGTYSGQVSNPTTGQFGGPYTSTGPTDGHY